MQLQDSAGDPTVAGLGAGVVFVLVLGGTAAAATTTDYTTPIITLVGAVFVATLTAVTTNRRQAKQLAAEGERLTRQLQAEQESQRQRLKHDREVKDLDHLREFFDENAAAWELTREALNELSSALFTRDLQRQRVLDGDGTSEAEGELMERDARCWDAYAKAERHLGTMYVLVRRMGLRLPIDHPVVKAITATIDALQERQAELYERLWSDVPNTEVHRDDEFVSDAVARWREFVDLARNELVRRGSVPPDVPALDDPGS